MPDWGWAPEYVEAMHRMLQRDEPDFVIASAKTFSLESFVDTAFSAVQLDGRKFVRVVDKKRSWAG
jgi:GDPmannose 4,6-dehydratase